MLRPTYPLETERLLLRPYTADDLDSENQFINGEWCDELVYAMLAADWQARTAAIDS